MTPDEVRASAPSLQWQVAHSLTVTHSVVSLRLCGVGLWVLYLFNEEHFCILFFCLLLARLER